MAKAKNNTKKIKEELRLRLANGLAKAAVILVKEHQKRIGRQNPGPLFLESSKPGEYPKKRTGTLQKSVFFEPSSISGIRQTLRVRVGYDNSAEYGYHLESSGRLGIRDTARDIADQLGQVIVSEGKK